MANWKKVLVSGSNIEVKNISGSTLNLSGLSHNADDVLIINGQGSISTVSQATIQGADPTFTITGQTGSNSAFNAGSDILLLTTASSGHGFKFIIEEGTEGTTTASLVTPQDLQTTATPTFNNLNVAGFIRHLGDSDTRITFADNEIQYNIGSQTPFKGRVTNINADNELHEIEIGSDNFYASATQKNFRFVVKGADPTQPGDLSSHLISTTGSKVGIGRVPDVNGPNKLHISGGNLFIEDGAITASLKTVSSTPGVVAYNTASGGFDFISGSDLLAGLSAEISGAFASDSASFASDIITNASNISTNEANITANTNKINQGIRFQEGAGTQEDGKSLTFSNTASFIGTANEVDIVHDGGTLGEAKFTFGLPNDVVIAESLTVGPNGTNPVTLSVSGSISASGGITASFIDVDGTVTAGNFIIQGTELIQNNIAIISGSTSFGSQSSNVHAFTGSVFVSGGNFTHIGSGGQTVINNGGITTAGSITASGAISSSANLFASLSQENQTQIVTYNVATGQFFHTASTAIGGTGTITIGDAPDAGGYTDGLFDDFVPSTPLGTAIDQINEVLAGLAPAQASDLDDIEEASTQGAGGTSEQPLDDQDFRLSFGGNNPIAGFTDCTSTTLSSPDSGLSSVSINGQYQATATSNDRRLGIMSASTAFFTPITGTLNADATADTNIAGTITNFGADSFGNGDKGVLAIIVNGVQVHSQSLSGSFGGDNFQTGAPAGRSINANGSGFVSLSPTQSAHFTATGNSLDTFKHRSGSFVVGSGDQRKGWNHVRIEHQLDGSTIQTNYLEWVTDDDNNAVTEANVTNVTFAGSGEKALSGVFYHTGFTATHAARINNAFRNVYNDFVRSHQDAIDSGGVNSIKARRTDFISKGTNLVEINSSGLDSVSANSSNGTLTLNNVLGAHSSSLDLTASYAHRTNTSFVDTDNIMDVSFLYEHPIKANIETTNKTAGDIILDNRTDTSTLTKETFISESFRLPSGSYNAQSDVVTGSYSSATDLKTSTGGYDTQLLVYPGINFNSSTLGVNVFGGSQKTNGILVHPVGGASRIDNVNFNVYSNKPQTNPNYGTGMGTNDRTYFRAFKNESGQSLPSINVKLQGHGAVIEPFTTALNDSNNIHIAWRFPGVTNYLDMHEPTTGGQNLQIEGHGCHQEPFNDTIDQSSTNNNNITFKTVAGGANVGLSDFIVIRITFGDGFTGYIGEIDLSTNLGS